MLNLVDFVRGQCPEVDAILVDRHIRLLPPGYFERYAAAEIARHLRLLATLGTEQRVAIELRPLDPQTYAVLLVGEDYMGTVACITAAVAAARLDLEDVQVHSYLQNASEEAPNEPAYFVISLRISGSLHGRTPAEFAAELRDRLEAAFAHLAQGNFLEAQTIVADTRSLADTSSTPRPDSLAPHWRRHDHQGLLLGGDFRLERKLASGGVGTVWLATQDSLKRTVAVKLFEHEGQEDDELLLRFNQEAQVLAQFSCGSIVQILAAGTVPHTAGGVLAWMAMEYLAGGDLARWHQKNGRPSADVSCRWFRQALEGLQYAHRRGVVHRDLKPHNLLLTADGDLKVSDFGLLKQAQRPSSELTPQAILLGTPYYMSPEQALGEAADERSDIFSLGTTFFHVLSGRLPFQKDSITALLAQIAQQDTPPLREVAPDAPLALATIIGRMMARRREERYQDIGVILEDLASYERRELLDMRSCDAPPAAIGPADAGEETVAYRLPDMGSG